MSFNYYNMNPRHIEYLDYLSDHRNNVNRSWNEILGPVIKTLYPDFYFDASRCIAFHDISKYDEEEFLPYCNWFYPCSGFEKDEKSFNQAWLRHQRLNPHHWQYWILVKDSGKKIVQDMPIEYICDMLCDWHSFSSKDPKSTAYNWYYNNKHKFSLSQKTISTVEFLIDYLTTPLSSNW